MLHLEEIQRGSLVNGLTSEGPATVIDVKWYGSACIELTFKDHTGTVKNELLYRDAEARLDLIESGRTWTFSGDSAMFRLASEAYRIHLAHLFDPHLAIHTSLVDPLPHQITAVYGEMIPRQPLRFLLADDPGAGKTIMAGLLIKELMARGDLTRALIVCPGSLAEQWQDELYQRFDLPFDILTNDAIDSARTGNWFAERNLVIARLDKLSRDQDVQAKLEATDWDLIVCDEAHKMSASYFSGEVKYTKRYLLGQLLSRISRHFLLMTATPHNGKNEDFHLFLALLDGDRFEGRFRDGEHTTDVSDLMRRLVKEQILKFDGKPLFPERRAYTVGYKLSKAEEQLYKAVTDYVRQEFNRADNLDESRRGTVGFALTILQRRLASSPEAIYQSLRRRRERLENRLREERLMKRAGDIMQGNGFTSEELDDLDDAPETEQETAENEVTDQATAARTIAELEAEIARLQELEGLALAVRRSGTDKKWEELSAILQNQAEMFDISGHRRKLVIFTEHRDTLNYLAEKLRGLVGQPEALVVVHGGMGREERRNAQEAFTQDKNVLIFLATDAAGEGINLQRAHLMVNYDLPWNPNRIEQRFGRIHRIGQTEVCHLWNLVAEETREGEVYHRLLEKIEAESAALGGGVFDILGQLFRETRLRDLLIQAIRYGDDPVVRRRLDEAVDNITDRDRCRDLLEQRALAHDSMDATEVRKIRADLERAQALRLQPHFVESFFLEAFAKLGGTIREREKRRYEITHVPPAIRQRDRQVGLGAAVLSRYERVTFEKHLRNVSGQPPAAFLTPGHPLLTASIDLILERYRDLLKTGALLIDPSDSGERIRALFYLEHSILDGRTDRVGNRRLISKRLQFVEIDEAGAATPSGPAPFLDYRPASEEEANLIAPVVGRQDWLKSNLEESVLGRAAIELVPEHLADVRNRKEDLVSRTLAAVQERLRGEIRYWDHRALHLQEQEQAGRVNARLNSVLARRRADDLTARLESRVRELEKERQISALPPIVVGGCIVVPIGLIAKLAGKSASTDPLARRAVEEHAMQRVMAQERKLGFHPVDVSAEKRGYDIESRDLENGSLRFIEVKGRAADADTVTVTRNEMMVAVNEPEKFVLALVRVDGAESTLHYIRRPFDREPQFGEAASNFRVVDLMSRAEAAKGNASHDSGQ
jgi:superfamily II DNA or RNA helicase